jgi:hypothetical protein
MIFQSGPQLGAGRWNGAGRRRRRESWSASSSQCRSEAGKAYCGVDRGILGRGDQGRGRPRAEEARGGRRWFIAERPGGRAAVEDAVACGARRGSPGRRSAGIGARLGDARGGVDRGGVVRGGASIREDQGRGWRRPALRGRKLQRAGEEGPVAADTRVSGAWGSSPGERWSERAWRGEMRWGRFDPW